MQFNNNNFLHIYQGISDISWEQNRTLDKWRKIPEGLKSSVLKILLENMVYILYTNMSYNTIIFNARSLN